MNILIAGDYCDKLRVKSQIAHGEYDAMFGNVKPIVELADFSIINFEFPIVRSTGAPIKKCGPNLKGQLASVDAIRYAGFNVATLANNHILDQGAECAVETQRALNDIGIKTVGLGGGRLQNRETILYLEKQQVKVAVINCCEHEFSVTSSNTVGANPLNPVNIFYQIQEARTQSDYVIVISHGGHEHFNLPSPRMKELYRYLVDAGADAVINHHQHCYSGYEIYKGKPIFYGLGNFLFDHATFRNKFWNEGYMVLLKLDEGTLSFDLVPYTQCNESASVQPMDKVGHEKFNTEIQRLNYIIADDSKLHEHVDEYYEKCSRYELANLEPYQGRVCSKLLSMGLLPHWIKGQKISNILNHVNCESHRDKLIYALTKMNK